MIPELNPHIPDCPSCGKPMRLSRTIPKLDDLPELGNWACVGCGVHFTAQRDLPV
jgi:hypothetical protein